VPEIVVQGQGASLLFYVCIGYNCSTGIAFLFQINITNPSNAKYVETIVPSRDLLAFTCEHKEDMNNLVRILRDEKDLKINVVHSGSEHRPFLSFKPSVSISNLR
jgi:hypothetical protein